MTIITYGNISQTNFIVIDTLEKHNIYRDSNKIFMLNNPVVFITACGYGLVLQSIHQYFVSNRENNIFNENDRQSAIEYFNELLPSLNYAYYYKDCDLVICSEEQVAEWSIGFENKTYINKSFNILDNNEIKMNSFGKISLIDYDENKHTFLDIENQMWNDIEVEIPKHHDIVPVKNFSFVKYHKMTASFYCKLHTEPINVR